MMRGNAALLCFKVRLNDISHMVRVELISNIFHYYYTALALQRDGLLQSYITGPCLRDNEERMRKLGSVFERLWAERRLEGISPERIKRRWLPELVQKGMTKCGATPEGANWACNELFARAAAATMRECDVVHFVHSIGWLAARKAKRLGIKVICDMREEHPRFQDELLSGEAKELGIEYQVSGPTFIRHVSEEIELADYIFCPSAYAKRTFVERGVSESRIVVCPYGVDRMKFAARDRLPRKQFQVLFLGRVCMRKGVHYLLEGFRRAQLSNAQLLLAGPVDPAFRSVLERYRGVFEELGPVSRSQVPAQYLAADVFVLPSLADSHGLVVSEAMSSGLPVIVSENTGMADLIENGREGFVVPIRDADAIADRLTFLHANRDQCIAMGDTGSKAIQARDWNHYQSMCSRIYRSLFGAGAGAAAAAAPVEAAVPVFTEARGESVPPPRH
jgi:glycosyltransferase involved in cell wall biosynthesis